MLIVNRGHRGLDTLAGIVSRLLGVSELPVDLYVYGVGDGYGAEVYVDKSIERARHIVHFLQTNTSFKVRLGLPTNPAHNPAVALSANIREHEYREIVAQVLLFILLIINSRVHCVVEAPKPAWTPDFGDYFTDPGGRARIVADIGADWIQDSGGREYDPAEVTPITPTLVGQGVRSTEPPIIHGRIIRITGDVCTVRTRDGVEVMYRMQDLVVNKI